MWGAPAIRHDAVMRRPSRAQIARFADYAIPWGVGIFLALVAVDDSKSPSPPAVKALGVLLAALPGGALRWRRGRPDLVMAITVAGGLAFQPVAPELVVPIPALFAMASLSAARPPRVSLPACSRCSG
jgi:hypothetical protein